MTLALTDAQRVMYGMTFVLDPDPHIFRPCPGPALEYCRTCAKTEFAGQHVSEKALRTLLGGR